MVEIQKIDLSEVKVALSQLIQQNTQKAMIKEFNTRRIISLM